MEGYEQRSKTSQLDLEGQGVEWLKPIMNAVYAETSSAQQRRLQTMRKPVESRNFQASSDAL